MEEREPKYCEKCGFELERILRTENAGFSFYTGKKKIRTTITYVCPKYTNPFLADTPHPSHTYITRTSEDNDDLAE